MRLTRLQLAETLRQVYFAGVRSLVIIVTGGFFVGLVLTLQTYDTLSRFGAADAASTVLALSLFRELGPVLTTLLFCRSRRHLDYCRNRPDACDRATRCPRPDGNRSDGTHRPAAPDCRVDRGTRTDP